MCFWFLWLYFSCSLLVVVEGAKQREGEEKNNVTKPVVVVVAVAVALAVNVVSDSQYNYKNLYFDYRRNSFATSFCGHGQKQQAAAGRRIRKKHSRRTCLEHATTQNVGPGMRAQHRTLSCSTNYIFHIIIDKWKGKVSHSPKTPHTDLPSQHLGSCSALVLELLSTIIISGWPGMGTGVGRMHGTWIWSDICGCWCLDIRVQLNRYYLWPPL